MKPRLAGTILVRPRDRDIRSVIQCTSERKLDQIKFRCSLSATLLNKETDTLLPHYYYLCNDSPPVQNGGSRIINHTKLKRSRYSRGTFKIRRQQQRKYNGPYLTTIVEPDSVLLQ